MIIAASLSDWALWLNLFLKFVEAHLSTIGSIKFTQDLSGFFLCNVETTNLQNLHKLTNVDLAVCIPVEAIEGLHDVEVRVGAQTLANGFCGRFDLEVHTPHVTVLNLCVGEVAVITSVQMVSMVRRSTLQHVGVIIVVANEGCAKFIVIESMVLISVVSLEEQIHLVCRWENPNCCETLSQISLADSSSPKMIEDDESVMHIEIRFHCQCNFGVLKFFLLTPEVLNSLHESLLLMGVQLLELFAGADFAWAATTQIIMATIAWLQLQG